MYFVQTIQLAETPSPLERLRSLIESSPFRGNMKVHITYSSALTLAESEQYKNSVHCDSEDVEKTLSDMFGIDFITIFCMEDPQKDEVALFAALKS